MNQRREIGVRELSQWELASVLPRICSLVSDLPGHTKSMGRMEDGRRDRLWAVRAPEQGEITHNQMWKEGFLKAVASGLWHKGSVRSFFSYIFCPFNQSPFFETV